jgi:type VI secretion system protein ImpF
MPDLQPCLLDRLTDDKDNRERRGVSDSRYQDAVRRDLEWLFGASAHLPKKVNQELRELDFHLEDYPDAFKSVINFGVRHLFGLAAPDVRDLQTRIKEALITFEPRIDPGSLKLKLGMDRNVIVLDIQGALWTPTGSTPLQIKTRIDPQSGYCTVK